MKRSPLKPGRDTGSFTNYLYSGSKQPAPAVGMGATILMWTDRHAATIIEVGDGFVRIQEDRATRTDANGMSESQDYAYAPNPAAKVETFTLRRNGAYVRQGETMNGTRLVIGERDEYQDPSF